MTDIELTKLCAEAMGIAVEADEGSADVLAFFVGIDAENAECWTQYDPLNDNEQAMCLIKQFTLHIWFHGGLWSASLSARRNVGVGQNPNLNRAIVECVAKMQEQK